MLAKYANISVSDRQRPANAQAILTSSCCLKMSKRCSAALTKATPTHASGHWPCIVRGEPTIDVSAFGAPVIAFDENRPEDVNAYMQMMEGARDGTLPQPAS